MKITRKIVAGKIAAYLHHELPLADLVEWAEHALMEGDLEDAQAGVLAAVIARLGLADVRAFGLAWEDCENLLRQLGFVARVDVVSA